MTDSPPDPAAETSAEEEAGGADGVDDYAREIGELLGSSEYSADYGTVKVKVGRDGWVEAITRLRDEAGLDFFSWLSAIDWSREVRVGDPVAEPADLDERFELLCRLATVTDERAALLSTDLPKEDAAVDSLVDVFGGAAWHERETHEMFGIDFRGHPQLVKLYLPDAFEGFPLRKSYPLLSREVKPWPGLVDVEDMPSTENPEAGDPTSGAAADDDAGDGDE